MSIGSARPLSIVQSSSDLWGVGSGRSNPHAAIFSGAKEGPDAYVAFAAASKAAVAADSSGNTTASTFYQNCLTAGTCREVAYNSYHGQTFFQFDARIANTITIHDRYAIQLFFQAFNMTNRANYGPNYDVNVSNALITTPSFLKPLGFINPSSTVVPRSFTGEFGARFSF
jgi:hypothetical protein